MDERSVLVVEDHDNTRRALRVLLSQPGWAVTLAKTAAEALEYLDGHPVPRCLILDLTLPVGDGEAVLRRVRDAGLTTIILVGTGVHDPEQLGQFSGMTPDAVFSKPLDFVELYRACERGVRVA